MKVTIAVLTTLALCVLAVPASAQKSSVAQKNSATECLSVEWVKRSRAIGGYIETPFWVKNTCSKPIIFRAIWTDKRSPNSRPLPSAPGCRHSDGGFQAPPGWRWKGVAVTKPGEKGAITYCADWPDPATGKATEKDRCPDINSWPKDPCR